MSAVLVPVPLPSWLNGVVKEDTFVSSNLPSISLSLSLSLSVSLTLPSSLPLSYYFMISRVVYRAVDSDQSCAQ